MERIVRAWSRRPWLTPAVLVAMLAAVTADVLAGGALTAADRAVRDGALAGWQSATWQWLDTLARLVVLVASPYADIAVLAVVALVLAYRRRSVIPALRAAAAIALLLATVVPAKWLIDRPGPAGLAATGLGYFPSGHTASVCVCYGAILFLLFPDPRPAARRARLAIIAVLGLVVGAALVWCQYHWLTDVIAAWLLAAIIVPLAGRLGDRMAARLARGRAMPPR